MTSSSDPKYDLGALEHNAKDVWTDASASTKLNMAGSAPTGTSAGSTLELRTASGLLSFDLRWPSGTLIKHIETFDISVERFKQDMHEGLIEEIPRPTTDIGGIWVEFYDIVWGTQVLQDGQWLSDYDIPQGATLTLLRQTQTAGPFF